jgi:NAD(P)-dependent dehydrogenase (short-subunit alcohol dehydrogenase family)
LDFKHKVVAITGAAGGIGQAMCAHFGSLGASMAALDKDDAVKTLPDKLAVDNIRAAAVDIADPERVRAGFAELAAALGPVDVLINNAGFSKHCTLELSSPASWRGDIEGNLNGAYYCAHAVLPAMKERRSGAILNIGSVNGLYALGDPAYSAAKAAMINFTKALAMEYGRFDIRANIILPGTVRTPLWEERASRNPKVLEELVRWYPLSRIVEPLDVARVAAFLCSDAAAAITGAVLPVDCGLSAGNIVMARELTVEPF